MKKEKIYIYCNHTSLLAYDAGTVECWTHCGLCQLILYHQHQRCCHAHIITSFTTITARNVNGSDYRPSKLFLLAL